MNRTPPSLGYSGPSGDGSNRLLGRSANRRAAGGFTLLEMVMVLVIIALLFGVSMPAMQSAFTEQSVRQDTHQIAIMVKTAMIQCSEQNRAYEMDLSETSISLHPVGQVAAAVDEANTASFDDTTPATNSGPVDVSVTNDFDSKNKLQMPDPIKVNAWMAVPNGTQWIFQPGELCPATHVRVARGDAWVEMSFNALTGDIENETFSLP